MGSWLPFELDARAALVAGEWTFVAATLVWLQILWLRQRQAREQRIVAQVAARWHPILSLASFGIPPEGLPALHRRERTAFLKLWVYLQSSLRGDARAALSDIAIALHCDRLALRMLARGHRGDRLLATVVAGHLGLASALPLLLQQAESRDSVLSLQALQAILRIAPERAADLAALCVRRADWPVSQLLPSLRACSTSLMPPLLAALDDNAGELRIKRALQLIAGLRLTPDAGQQERLMTRASPLLLAESLPLVDQPALLPQLRACLVHEDERVRAAAADALARLGDASDLQQLARGLTDPSWPVRHAAARAIVALPGGGPAALRLAGQVCGDRYGRNMAEHVLADLRLAS